MKETATLYSAVVVFHEESKFLLAIVFLCKTIKVKLR